MAVQTPGSLRSRFNIDVRVNTRVVNINTETKTVSTINEIEPSLDTKVIAYDQLVLGEAIFIWFTFLEYLVIHTSPSISLFILYYVLDLKPSEVNR